MKKIFGILPLGFILILLNSCAATNDALFGFTYEKYQERTNFNFYAEACPENKLDVPGCGLGGSNDSQNDANNNALIVCGQNFPDCIVIKEGKQWVYSKQKQIVTTSSNSYSGSSSSSYSSNSYSNAKPKLYYNSSTGGMSECAYDTGVTGKCWSFKPYKASLYDKDTLFYNPSTNSMQPCIGIITVNGKCSAYGIFNYKEATADKGQLYYDPKNKKMTTCRHVTISGSCAHYDLVPNSWAKNDTGFRMTNPSNPYHKKVPQTSQDLINLGTRMLSGNCTLGLNC